MIQEDHEDSYMEYLYDAWVKETWRGFTQEMADECRRKRKIRRKAMKWDRRFLEVAKVISTWSKDPSTKTGCVVVNDRRRILSTGYNGFPMGVHDDEARYENRDLKYKLVAHCDSNAVYSAAMEGVSLLGCTMYLTGPPCNECMKAIIQSGIKRVVWPLDNGFEKDGEPLQERWRESIRLSLMMADEAGIVMDRV